MKVNLVSKNYTENYLENLMKERGIENLTFYLNPTSSVLQDPENLDNIAVGWEFLKNTLNSNGSILLVVDCDVDGYTSGAIIYKYIKRIDPSPLFSFLTFWRTLPND